MRRAIPYGRQDISDDDIQAVVNVLRSDYLTQGPVVPTFEGAVAEYCGVAHAVAANSATSALHIACLALGVGPGDWVWTSPNTFVASANCALYCGAKVDFVDIDPQTYNMGVEALRSKLERAEAKGNLPKVVIPVHFAGQGCEMKDIKALSEQYGFSIIEDASHAIGGKYLGESIGNCRYSDITVFSFHPVKIVTTGEGGMATTHSPELARRMQLLRSHVITREAGEMIRSDQGELYYEQIGLGFNYRMTDIHAALGLSQMSRLESFVARRHALADSYGDALRELPLQTPWQHPDTWSSWHLYVVQLHDAGLRREVTERLRAAGILVNIHYIPVHTQPYYQQMGFRDGNFPEAERYYQRAFSLPLYPAMTDEAQAQVVDTLRRVLSA